MTISPIKYLPSARIFINANCLLALVAGIFSSIAPLSFGADGSRDQICAVGVTSRAFADPERSNWPRTGPRPIRVTLWYPCASGQVQEMLNDAGTQLPAIRDASVSTILAKYPL